MKIKAKVAMLSWSLLMWVIGKYSYEELYEADRFTSLPWVSIGWLFSPEPDTLMLTSISDFPGAMVWSNSPVSSLESRLLENSMIDPSLNPAFLFCQVISSSCMHLHYYTVTHDMMQSRRLLLGPKWMRSPAFGFSASKNVIQINLFLNKLLRLRYFVTVAEDGKVNQLTKFSWVEDLMFNIPSHWP